MSIPADSAPGARWLLLTALVLPLAACERSAPEPSDAARAVVAREGPPSARPRPAPPAPGRWRRIPKEQLDPDRDAERIAMIEQLEAIGYASGSMPGFADTGLVLADPERTTPGHTFLTSGHAPGAFLIDAAGQIVHRWQHAAPASLTARGADASLASSAAGPAAERDEPVSFWRRAQLLPNGHVLAIFDGVGLIEIDAESRLVWARANGAHHDLARGPGGEIHVLTREAHVVEGLESERPVLEDFVEVLAPDGTLLERWSLLEAFERSAYAGLARERLREGGDVFHTNSIELLSGRLAQQLPAFAAGNVLVSFLTLDAIAVVDPAGPEIVWLHRGGFRAQHDPQVLGDGGLLLFDNRGGNAGDVRASAVLELDPATGAERWAYRGSTERPFYSHTCGVAQRLPDGNTLITESDRGRALETTPGGDVVWEYRNPFRAGPEGEFIATLFEAWRVPPDFPLDWLGDASLRGVGGQ